MQLGRYRLVRELGRGGTGVAYEAVDEQGRKLCVKVIHTHMAQNGEAMERVRREIVLTNRIRNPMVCHALGLEVVAGHVVVVMELAEGVALSDLLKARGTLTVDEVLALGVALSAALASAHAVGVIHRDVKPANVVVLPSGAIKLLDFGVATATDLKSSLTKPGALLGTRSYIAPEVWVGEAATAQSDQYAVGVVLYRALTGQLPYPQKDAFLLDAMLKTKPPPPRSIRPEIPALVEALVMRVLSARPADRFEDMNALSLVLQQAKQQWLAFAAHDTIVQERPSFPSPTTTTTSNATHATTGATSGAAASAPVGLGPSTGPNLAVIEDLLQAADAAAAAQPTLELPPASDGDSDSASWVVNGQAVGAAHVQPKTMEVPIAGITAALEPAELPLRQQPGATRFGRALAVFVVLVAAVAFAVWWLRHH